MNKEKTTQPNSSPSSSIAAVIERKIKAGEILMRPRWHFVLKTLLAGMLVIIVFLALVYIGSLAIFVEHQSHFAPGAPLPPHSLREIITGLPWLLLGLTVAFLIILEVLVQRFAFAYRRPVLVTFSVMLVLFLIIAASIEQSGVHTRLRNYSRSHRLPPGAWFYRRYERRLPPIPAQLNLLILPPRTSRERSITVVM